jgi:hypothetical protein
MTPPPDPTHPLYNPDSGRHALPHDPREIAAVLRATQRCYDAHPYYLARYGARGRRFSQSDGGYLVTLASAWQGHVHEQVAWLASLLAARGMPCWLMECHLRILQEELCRGIPEDHARFARLGRAAHRLRMRRLARMAQADFDAVAAEFEAAAGPGIDNAGGLLAGAVCDERGGSAEALPRLLEWLRDPGRFSPRWCAAVDQAIARARATPVPKVRSPRTRPEAARKP